MRGAMGLRLDTLQHEHIEWLKGRLTVSSKPYKNQEPIVVESFEQDEHYLWVPRYFDHLNFWPKIKAWEWAAPPLDYPLHQLMTPDPKRKQPEAIDTLEEHLRKHSGCIGVMPTGLGKTLVALSVARRFKTPIGIFIYAGHMIDNWYEHASSVLGVPAEDVGLVKEGRCDLGKPITVISIQTVMCRELPERLFKQIGFIIADEIHHFGSKIWGKVVNSFPARYRLGISADPTRPDGLDPVVRWNFGKVGYSLHTRPTGELPTVYLTRFPSNYTKRKYHDWEQGPGGKWEMTTPNAMKYDKLLMRDKPRNEWIVGKLIEARLKGRRIMVFSRLRDHLDALYNEFLSRWKKALLGVSDVPERISKTTTSLLRGGIKDRDRPKAMIADVIFTTFGYSREALNATHLDTMIFATPPGNPLQPAGRLRDKGDEDRKSLLILDPFEMNEYSFDKAMRRRSAYGQLGLTVKRIAGQA